MSGVESLTFSTWRRHTDTDAAVYLLVRLTGCLLCSRRQHQCTKDADMHIASRFASYLSTEFVLSLADVLNRATIVYLL